MLRRDPRFNALPTDVQMRLCVGNLAVPSEDIVVILGDNFPPTKKTFISVQGERSSFHMRWLEQSLNLKKGSLSLDKWPLGREMVAAKDAAFGERKGRMKRVSKAGSVFPKSSSSKYQCGALSFPALHLAETLSMWSAQFRSSGSSWRRR